MSSQNNTGKNGNCGDGLGVELEEIRDSGQDGESDQTGDDAFAHEQHPKDGEAAVGNGNRERVNGEGSHARRDAFAAVETQLRGPDVADDDADSGAENGGFSPREVASEQNGGGAFAEVADYGQEESGLAELPADISRAAASTAELADVLACAPTDQIVTGGETTEKVPDEQSQPGVAPERFNLSEPMHLYREVIPKKRSSIK